MKEPILPKYTGDKTMDYIIYKKYLSEKSKRGDYKNLSQNGYLVQRKDLGGLSVGDDKTPEVNRKLKEGKDISTILAELEIPPNTDLGRNITAYVNGKNNYDKFIEEHKEWDNNPIKDLSDKDKLLLNTKLEGFYFNEPYKTNVTRGDNGKIIGGKKDKLNRVVINEDDNNSLLLNPSTGDLYIVPNTKKMDKEPVLIEKDDYLVNLYKERSEQVKNEPTNFEYNYAERYTNFYNTTNNNNTSINKPESTNNINNTISNNNDNLPYGNYNGDIIHDVIIHDKYNKLKTDLLNQARNTKDKNETSNIYRKVEAINNALDKRYEQKAGNRVITDKPIDSKNLSESDKLKIKAITKIEDGVGTNTLHLRNNPNIVVVSKTDNSALLYDKTNDKYYETDNFNSLTKQDIVTKYPGTEAVTSSGRPVTLKINEVILDEDTKSYLTEQNKNSNSGLDNYNKFIAEQNENILKKGVTTEQVEEDTTAENSGFNDRYLIDESEINNVNNNIDNYTISRKKIDGFEEIVFTNKSTGKVEILSPKYNLALNEKDNRLEIITNEVAEKNEQKFDGYRIIEPRAYENDLEEITPELVKQAVKEKNQDIVRETSEEFKNKIERPELNNDLKKIDNLKERLIKSNEGLIKGLPNEIPQEVVPEVTPVEEKLEPVKPSDNTNNIDNQNPIDFVKQESPITTPIDNTVPSNTPETPVVDNKVENKPTVNTISEPSLENPVIVTRTNENSEYETKVVTNKEDELLLQQQGYFSNDALERLKSQVPTPAQLNTGNYSVVNKDDKLVAINKETNIEYQLPNNYKLVRNINNGSTRVIGRLSEMNVGDEIATNSSVTNNPLESYQTKEQINAKSEVLKAIGLQQDKAVESLNELSKRVNKPMTTNKDEVKSYKEAVELEKLNVLNNEADEYIRNTNVNIEEAKKAAKNLIKVPASNIISTDENAPKQDESKKDDLSLTRGDKQALAAMSAPALINIGRGLFEKQTDYKPIYNPYDLQSLALINNRQLDLDRTPARLNLNTGLQQIRDNSLSSATRNANMSNLYAASLRNEDALTEKESMFNQIELPQQNAQFMQNVGNNRRAALEQARQYDIQAASAKGNILTTGLTQLSNVGANYGNLNNFKLANKVALSTMGTKDFTVNPEVMSGNVDTPIIYRNATTQDDNEEEYETKQKGGYTDSKVILEDLIKLKSKLKDMKKSVKTKYR